MKDKSHDKPTQTTPKQGNVVLGATLIIIGALFLLAELGLISLSSIAAWWPVGLVAAGIAFLARAKGLAVLLIVLSLVLAATNLAGHFEPAGPERHLSQHIPLKETTRELELALHFGAGELSLQGGSEHLLKNRITTHAAENPRVTYRETNGTAKVTIERAAAPFSFGGEETWNLSLNEGVIHKISMDYGAAEMILDLTDLRVELLDIDSGATSTEITFGDYPTRVEISTGASSYDLYFPTNASVVIDVDAGASSIDLPGFEKDGDTYVRNPSDTPISVSIDAGASDIEAHLY